MKGNGHSAPAASSPRRQLNGQFRPPAHPCRRQDYLGSHLGDRGISRADLGSQASDLGSFAADHGSLARGIGIFSGDLGNPANALGSPANDSGVLRNYPGRFEKTGCFSPNSGQKPQNSPFPVSTGPARRNHGQVAQKHPEQARKRNPSRNANDNDSAQNFRAFRGHLPPPLRKSAPSADENSLTPRRKL